MKTTKMKHNLLIGNFCQSCKYQWSIYCQRKKKYLNTIRYELLHKYGYIYILYGLSLYNIIEEHMKKKKWGKTQISLNLI